MTLRMIKSTLNWVASDKGNYTKAGTDDIVELDFNAAILVWLKEVRTRLGSPLTDAQLGNFITNHPPENWLKNKWLTRE